MRVVIDANIFVSASFSPDGPPGKAMRAWLAGLFVLIVSQDIVAEWREVMSRPRVARRRAWSDETLSHVLYEVEHSAVSVVPATLSVPGISPADAAYLAAAVTGQADFLVTGDNEVLALREHGGTRIVTATEFLIELQLTGRR